MSKKADPQPKELGKKQKGRKPPSQAALGFGSSPALLQALQMHPGALCTEPNPYRAGWAPTSAPHPSGLSKRIVGGHLITSMNHSQIAPVQPASGVVVPTWGWEPGTGLGVLGSCGPFSLAGDQGSGPGLLVPPLSLPAVASPPPSACRIHHCCSAVLSGPLRRRGAGWGVELERS